MMTTGIKAKKEKRKKRKKERKHREAKRRISLVKLSSMEPTNLSYDDYLIVQDVLSLVLSTVQETAVSVLCCSSLNPGHLLSALKAAYTGSLEVHNCHNDALEEDMHALRSRVEQEST